MFNKYFILGKAKNYKKKKTIDLKKLFLFTKNPKFGKEGKDIFNLIMVRKVLFNQKYEQTTPLILFLNYKFVIKN